ncbi:MAG TPA: hypothetical protein VFE30_08315 [Anaeromyxobacteraceae bacterium]|jgi:hypothetical protein|nr:hypothetical protein [Anaeromyxobacteraceae bacterium]
MLGQEPNQAENVIREGAIRLIAETLPLTGYGGIRADLPGWDSPELIHGALRDHRPSLSATSPKTVYFDVIAAAGPVSLEDVASRWQLFASAADLTQGEFHVVVPRWVGGRDGRSLAKQLAELVGVRIGYIWAI